MLKCGIYSITNKKTGQKYIGQSKDITRRLWQHKNKGQDASRIDRAIKKHGVNAFEFEILEECKPNELNELEEEYIKKYNTYEDENHYNLTSGGDSNYQTSAETRKKMSVSAFERHNGKGTQRDIKYLLKRYYAKDGFTEKKRVGEVWSPYHDAMAKREERTFARLDLLETIINERKTVSRGTFQFSKSEKDRARYLIKRISFNRGRQSAEQTIVMIIVYVKLEADEGKSFQQYKPLLKAYDIEVNSFIKFLIYLSKFHYERNN